MAILARGAEVIQAFLGSFTDCKDVIQPPKLNCTSKLINKVPLNSAHMSYEILFED